ncbi:MAG: hypothetical protein AAB558_04070 [Patescibacteria group bacterium]
MAKRRVKKVARASVAHAPVVGTNWLSWFLLVGVGLAMLGVTGANFISSELTKTILLTWVIVFGLVSWFSLLLSRGAVSWSWHWLDLAVLFWFGVNVAAALHSDLPRVSVWGFGDLYGDGLMAATAAVVLFVLMVNIPGRFSLKHWLWLVAALGALGSLGVWITTVSPVTVSFISRLASQTGVFLAVCVPVVLSLRLSLQWAWERWVSMGVLVLCMTALIFLDQSQAWWVLLVGLAIWLLGQRLITSTQLVQKSMLVAGLMAFAVISLSLEVGVFQTDIFLSTADTWQLIAQQLHNPGLGVGQQNFVLLSAAQNPTATAFVTLASSSVLSWLVGLGIIGVVAWGSVVGCMLWCLLKEWRRTNPTQEQWGAFSAWVAVVVAAFILPVGLASLVLFWVLLAALHRSLWSPADWSIKSERLITTFSMLALAVSAVFLLFSLWVGGRLLLAQYHYWTAQELYAQGTDAAEVKIELQAAQRLAPQAAEYNFALAELLLIQEEATPQGLIEPIQNLIREGLRTAPYQLQWKNILEQLTQSTEE